jgi:hypothetical protein
VVSHLDVGSSFTNSTSPEKEEKKIGSRIRPIARRLELGNNAELQGINKIIREIKNGTLRGSSCVGLRSPNHKS